MSESSALSSMSKAKSHHFFSCYSFSVFCRRAYLKKKKLEHQLVENQEVYEEAFAEFCRWFLRHSSSLQSHRVQGKYPPQAIPTHALLGLLKEHPPRKEFSYQVLGLESWEDFAHGCQGIDIEAKGYFIKTDINMFWERYGIRDVQMKNRESTTMKGMGSFLMVSQKEVS